MTRVSEVIYQEYPDGYTSISYFCEEKRRSRTPIQARIINILPFLVNNSVKVNKRGKTYTGYNVEELELAVTKCLRDEDIIKEGQKKLLYSLINKHIRSTGRDYFTFQEIRLRRPNLSISAYERAFKELSIKSIKLSPSADIVYSLKSTSYPEIDLKVHSDFTSIHDFCEATNLRMCERNFIGNFCDKIPSFFQADDVSKASRVYFKKDLEKLLKIFKKNNGTLTHSQIEVKNGYIFVTLGEEKYDFCSLPSTNSIVVLEKFSKLYPEETFKCGENCLTPIPNTSSFMEVRTSDALKLVDNRLLKIVGFEETNKNKYTRIYQSINGSLPEVDDSPKDGYSTVRECLDFIIEENLKVSLRRQLERHLEKEKIPYIVARNKAGNAFQRVYKDSDLEPILAPLKHLITIMEQATKEWLDEKFFKDVNLPKEYSCIKDISIADVFYALYAFDKRAFHNLRDLSEEEKSIIKSRGPRNTYWCKLFASYYCSKRFSMVREKDVKTFLILEQATIKRIKELKEHHGIIFHSDGEYVTLCNYSSGINFYNWGNPYCFDVLWLSWVAVDYSKRISERVEVEINNIQFKKAESAPEKGLPDCDLGDLSNTMKESNNNFLLSKVLSWVKSKIYSNNKEVTQDIIKI